jgi:hypothetical protein
MADGFLVGLVEDQGRRSDPSFCSRTGTATFHPNDEWQMPRSPALSQHERDARTA